MAFWAIFRSFWAILLPTFGAQVGLRVKGFKGLRGLRVWGFWFKGLGFRVSGLGSRLSLAFPKRLQSLDSPWDSVYLGGSGVYLRSL